MDAEPTESRSNLGRADAILAAFDEQHLALTLTEIMTRTGLPKTTVHRALDKMVELGWLDRDHDRYCIGARLSGVARPS